MNWVIMLKYIKPTLGILVINRAANDAPTSVQTPKVNVTQYPKPSVSVKTVSKIIFE